jgi:hypothetical protein
MKLKSEDASYDLVQTPFYSRLVLKNVAIIIFKIIMMRIILHEFETSSFTLTGEYRLPVLAKKMLREASIMISEKIAEGTS